MAGVTDTDFTLRSIAVPAFGPTVLFGIVEGAIIPVIALSALDRGANVALASLIAALIGIASFVSNIPAGNFAARYGEKRAMLVGMGISIVGILLCVFEWGLASLAVGVFLFGIATSIFYLARQSYLTEAVPASMRARALSTLGGSMRIGVFLGPFLAAGIMHFTGLAGAYWLALAAAIAAGIIVLLLPDLDLEQVRGDAAAAVTTRGILRDYRGVLATLGSTVLLIAAIRQTRQVVIPLWADHVGLDPVQSSLIYGLSGALDAAVFYPAGKIMDHRGVAAVAIPSMIGLGLAFIAMPFTSGFWTLGFVAMAMGLTNGVGSGIVMTMGAEASPAVGRPVFLGVWRSFSDFGSGVGPLLLAAVTALATLDWGIIVSGAVGIGAGALLWRWAPRGHPVEVVDDDPD